MKCLVMGAVLLTAVARAGAAQDPRAQLQSSIDAAVSLLKDASLNPGARRESIRGLVERRFDFQTMARGVLAADWATLTPAQQALFVSKFSTLIENTYLGLAEAYTNERVEYVGMRIDARRADIDTLIVGDRISLPVRYKMQRQGDDWRVYDVVIEKTSLMRSRREAYQGVLRKQGIGGLLHMLDQNLEKSQNPQ